MPVNIPNTLTMLRLILSPLFLIIYINMDSIGLTLSCSAYILLVILLLAELTDFLDGYLARRYQLVTDFGKIFDPMADSVIRLGVFLAFTQGIVQLPLLPTFLVFYRESLISSLRTVCALRGYALAARPSGKAKAVTQAIVSIVIVIMMILVTKSTITITTLQVVSYYSIWLCATISWVTGIEYLYVNRKDVSKLLKV
jgi:CDP-diacylglycerol--glycerol-3-phosphate 3-phosphatidyltransferase